MIQNIDRIWAQTLLLKMQAESNLEYVKQNSNAATQAFINQNVFTVNHFFHE